MIKEMKENCLSIITNFGCHYTCPYCIVKNNNLRIPKTTIKGLYNLRQSIIDNNINIISISGGGDPCHDFELHIDWYIELANIMREFNIPLELHTSYLNVPNFPYEMFSRIVYHFRDLNKIHEIKQYNNEIIRVVFVVTEQYSEELINSIVEAIKNNKESLELTFRQMVDSSYNTTKYLYNFLKDGHKKDWWYIEQDDYNLYYSENKLSTKYEDFKMIK